MAPRGDRLLEIQVNTTADGDFVSSFEAALALGAQSQTFSVDWSAIDIGSDTHGDPVFEGGTGSELLTTANSCYPNSNTQVSMMLRPITTLVKSVPPGFENLPFDDPRMIARFRQTLDHVFDLIPDLMLTSLAIGSEIDFYLLDNARRQQYATFYADAANYAREAYAARYPQNTPLRVTTEVTHKALLDSTLREYYLQLHAHSDTIGVSYYPLEDNQVLSPDRVGADFADLVALYGSKPLVFFQLGYPSGYFDAAAYGELARGEVSPSMGSSDALQAQFIDTVFQAWDTHADSIDLISFTWLNDVTQEGVAETIANPAFGGGVPPTPGFVEFLRTLGLRTESGVSKLAFERLAANATLRGWEESNATLSCVFTQEGTEN